MSFFRSVLLASLISLLAALGLLYLGFSMGYEEFRGGYAVITVDASIDDRELRSVLEAGNYFGPDFISESSQWVMLDEFDALRRIPLDNFSSRIFPFDPRNDGYADKLREVFVKDNKRFVYIPLFAGNWNSGLLDRKFNDLLVDINYSVDYFGIGRPLALFFIVYSAASVILLILCYLNRKVHRSIVNIIPMIPVLSSLGFFGAAGIGCAALLFGLFILLKEPLNELVNPPAAAAKGFDKRMNQLYKEIILPYRYYWLFLPVFIFAFTVLIIFSQLKMIFLLSIFIASFAVFFFSLKIVSLSGVEHKRFNPVTIVRRRFPVFVFPVYILPFVIGAFLTVFLAPYMSGSFDNKDFEISISENDYHNHLTHQVTFSTVQMGSLASDFPSYFFDTDGLPSVRRTRSRQNINFNEYPAFPLKHLTEFFHNISDGSMSEKSPGTIADKLYLLILIVFLFPGFLMKYNINASKSSMESIKKLSGKLRLMGINWNKILLYNKNSRIRSRKDA